MNDKEIEETTRIIVRDSLVAILMFSVLVISTLYICTLNEIAAIIAAIITYILGMLFIFKACDSDEELNNDNN